jgi:peroxiredoxin
MSLRRVRLHTFARLPLISAVAVLVVYLLAFQTAFSIELKWGAGEESITIGSVQKRRTVYLNLADVERSLPITVRRDSEAGLFVLCTETTCLPVFQIDPEEYLQRNSVEFIGADQVAQAFECKFNVSKDHASFECAQNAERFRRVGSAEGDVAPGIRSTMRDAKIVALSELRRDHKVVIAFVRSLDWDPFSQMLVRRLQSVQDSLRAANAQVVVIHGYGEKQTAIWQDSLKLSIPLQADDASAAMRGYDVFDRGPLPHPAVFVVDQSGIIRLRKVFEDLSVAPDISAVMEAVAPMP